MIFQKQLPEPEKFLPERWIENKKEICPFSVRQFSHGPRMNDGAIFNLAWPSYVRTVHCSCIVP